MAVGFYFSFSLLLPFWFDIPLPQLGFFLVGRGFIPVPYFLPLLDQ